MELINTMTTMKHCTSGREIQLGNKKSHVGTCALLCLISLIGSLQTARAQLVTHALTAGDLGLPTRAELLSGPVVVNNLFGYTGLTATVTFSGTSTTGANPSPEINGANFKNGISNDPANDILSNRYTFNFSSTGNSNVERIEFLSSNSMFYNNGPGGSDSVRETVRVVVDGSNTWSALNGYNPLGAPNPGQQVRTGVDTNLGTITVNNPGNDAQYSTGGFRARSAVGGNISMAYYQYNVLQQENATDNNTSGQLFQVNLWIRTVPEPSSAMLSGLGLCLLVLRRKR